MTERGKPRFNFRLPNPFKQAIERKIVIPEKTRELRDARIALEGIHHIVSDLQAAPLLKEDHELGTAMRLMLEDTVEGLFASGVLPMEVTKVKLIEGISFSRSDEELSMVPNDPDFRKTWSIQDIDQYCAMIAIGLKQEWTPLFPPETPEAH